MIFDDPALRRLLKEAKAAADIRIDTISTDAVVSSGWDAKKAADTVERFKRFLEERRDELTALQILYQRPYAAKRRRGSRREPRSCAQPLSECG